MTTTANLQTDKNDTPVVSSSTSANRKRANKPLMEKRRRARINQSLANLRNLILDYLKKESTRTSKLEKADILETTLRYLQELQRHQTAVKIITDPSISNKFQAGYNECIKEVQRYMQLNMESTNATLCQNVIAHITSVGKSSQPPTNPGYKENGSQVSTFPVDHFGMPSPSPDGTLTSDLTRLSVLPSTLYANDCLEPVTGQLCSVQVLQTGHTPIFVLQDLQTSDDNTGGATSPATNSSGYRCKQSPSQTLEQSALVPNGLSREGSIIGYSVDDGQKQAYRNDSHVLDSDLMWRPW